MNNRANQRWMPRLVAAALVLLPVVVTAQQQWRERTVVETVSGPWTGPRLPDGQPDIQGHWSNTIGNHNNLTDPQGPLEGDVDAGDPARPRDERAPSRVSDPPDGQVPFQPWARAKQQELLAHLNSPVKPEYVEPLARCAPAGPTKSFMWHGYEIRQYPGYVLFLFDAGSRLIHLDRKPHLPGNIKLWNADSRGRWDGNTLVVDVRNNNGKARLGRSGEFASEHVHIRERYIFDGNGERFTYAQGSGLRPRPWARFPPAPPPSRCAGVGAKGLQSL
ncbi:MAG: hypothetical protein ACRD2X_02650 [Vicinamibacteraceae bacterium]